MSKSILYLCPSIPYPANNGGKVVFNNHIDFLKNNGFDIHAVFLDVDCGYQNIAKADLKNKGFASINVFSREVPRIKGLTSIIKSLYYFATNIKPRAFIARYNPELQEFVRREIVNLKYDYIIFDHFTSLSFIDDFEILKSCNSIYIAHNFEAKVIADQFKSLTNPILKLIYYIEYCKTKRIEKQILEKISRTITISSTDRNELSDFYGNFKLKNIPEIIPLKANLWSFFKTKNILFVGGTDYYPNYEAVNWIVKVLMPALNKMDINVTCTIVGNSINYKYKYLSPNVFFTGRIDDQELENLYTSSNLFISPVILGSGIKVKVLTALSYGIPVLCTRESMNGIDYLIGLKSIIFERKNLEKSVSDILNLVNDSDQQLKLSSLIKKAIIDNLNIINQQWSLNEI
jgi:glycosyltransferase involved in cell wall biosynthesis